MNKWSPQRIVYSKQRYHIIYFLVIFQPQTQGTINVISAQQRSNHQLNCENILQEYTTKYDRTNVTFQVVNMLDSHPTIWKCTKRNTGEWIKSLHAHLKLLRLLCECESGSPFKKGISYLNYHLLSAWEIPHNLYSVTFAERSSTDLVLWRHI